MTTYPLPLPISWPLSLQVATLIKSLCFVEREAMFSVHDSQFGDRMGGGGGDEHMDDTVHSPLRCVGDHWIGPNTYKQGRVTF